MSTHPLYQDLPLDPYGDSFFEDQMIEAFQRGYNKPTFEEAETLEVREAERQARIAAGVETACAGCGCSDSRACPGGCVWATEALCSRCYRSLP